MADLKISQLGSIITVVPATDVLPVVQGATTYKVTPNQLLGAGGVATLASATITGALTVDTTTLVVDATNDRVGIGTATPSYKFHAVATSGAVGAFRASTAAIARLLVGNTVGDLEIKVNANSDGQITSDAGKYLGLGSNTSNDRVILDTSGNLSITNGNVVMATSGKGIDFGATSSPSAPIIMTSELLNDYEEGTFTPIVLGSTTAGVGVYSIQDGAYTKIGRLVTVNIYIVWTAHTGTGNLKIGGLPFTSGGFYAAATVGVAGGIALSASNTICAFNQINSTNIYIIQQPVGGGADTDVPMDIAGSMILNCTYAV